MRKYLLSILLLCCTTLWASAADRIVKGTVTSAEDGFMLIGAAVFLDSKDLESVEDSWKGVVTDVDGNFTIQIPEGINRFFCSYLGHATQEVKLVPGKDHYTIVLKPESQMLDAVVVTGYQTIEKRKLTAAVTKVDLSDAVIGSVKSVDQALAGQIAGLQVTSTSGAPGAPMKIRIRGTSSLNGTQDPLWVLDGIPLEGTDIPKHDNVDIDNIRQSSIAGINPADIENITVLKDAAATAIYGARAANGVIVITTKSGKQGKPRVNFSTRLTYSPRLSTSRLNLMNSDEKVSLELDLLRSPFTIYNQKGEVYRTLDRHGLVQNYIDGGMDALTPEALKDLEQLRSTNTDWGKILFRDAFNQEYNVNISGGGEKVTYYNSVGYNEENGNVKGVKNNRLNIVSKTSYRMNDMFKVGASIFANRRKNDTYLRDKYGLINPLYYSRRANPYFRSYDENGNYLYDYDVQNSTDTDLGFNIFEERANTSSEETINSIATIFDLEFRLNDHFKFTTQLGLQYDSTSKEEIADKESFTMRDLRKLSRYTNSEGKPDYFLPEGGFHKAYENTNSQMTWKGMGEYRTSIGDNHELEVMLGSELRKTKYETLFTAGYGFDRKTLTTKPVLFPDEDKARMFPLHTKTSKENAYASFFSTMSYSFKQRYTFGGSIRMDGSDLFGVAKKYRYLPLYSVSTLWRLSNESFMASATWLDNLALRASYGLQGNIDKNTSPYLVGDYRVDAILPGGSEHMIEINSAPNAKLRWEKTHSVNAGLDVSVLDSRINMSLDYYYRKGVDLIGLQMLPLESGFTSSTINWASMTNQGIELALSTRNIVTKNFTWETNFNFSYNNNKVLRETVADNATYPSREGYPVGAIFAFKTAGLDQDGYPLFVNKKGDKVTLKELYRLEDPGWGFPMASSDVTPQEEREFYSYKGTSEPPYTGGIINNFTYKNWELSVNFAYNFGGHVRTSPSYEALDYDRGKNTNKDILDRWTPDNTSSKLPALFTDDKRMDEYYWYSSRNEIYRNLDIWVKKLNYIRLQNIRLGYRLPDVLLKHIGLHTATVALEGRNLFVAGANYKNYLDPESMGNPYAAPMPKSVTFNLNLSF